MRRSGRLIAAVLALAAARVRAIGVGDVGTTSANFLKIPADARPVGMGEAYTAVANDQASLDYNPAGIVRSLQDELSATDIQWFQGLNLGHLGGIAPFGNLGTGGLGVTWLNDGPLVATQRTGSGPLDYVQAGTFTPYDLALEGAWAWSPWRGWDFGVEGRLIQQVIDTYSGWGADLALGVQRTRLWGWLDLGASVQNLGTSIAVAQSAALEPLTLRTGAAARLFGGRLTLAADLAVPTDNAPVPSLGGEWWVFPQLALRAGWMGGYASEPTAGVGFLYSIFRLDYAFQPFAALGDTNRVSVSVFFGGPEVRVNALRPLLGPLGGASWRQGGFRPDPDRPADVVAWSLEVVGPDGVVDRTWSGAGPPPSVVPWDGRDGWGRVLPDGIYRARFRARYPGGLSAEAQGGPVELDSTPPTVGLEVSPIVARPGLAGALAVPAHLRLTAHDRNGVGGWKLEVRDSAGRVVRAFSGDGPPPAELVWNGDDDRGAPCRSGATYLFWPSAKDRLGNWGAGPARAMIVLMREIHYDLSSDALFEPGKADVRISAYQQLFALKKMILAQARPGSTVDVIGHTDDTPVVRSVYRDNDALSLARAQAVCKFLVDLLGMDPKMLRPVGKGARDPRESDATAAGREANRRVEVVIHLKGYE